MGNIKFMKTLSFNPQSVMSTAKVKGWAWAVAKPKGSQNYNALKMREYRARKKVSKA